MGENSEHIIIFLKQYLDGKCDEETNHEIEKWLAASEKNKELWKRIRSKKILVEKLKFDLETDKEKDWKEICLRIRTVRYDLKFRYLFRYVAILVLLLGGILLYLGRENGIREDLPLVQEITDSIRPGYLQACLELADGEMIHLGDTVNRIEKKIKGTILKELQEGLVMFTDDSTSLVYKATDYYTLTVPRGGEYHLTLSDGTKVWMNSDSKLEFPPSFQGENRIVRLSGEAYFEVKSDKKHPFIVETQDVKVRVLGTSFNLYAFENEVNTTLVEGLVSIQAEGKTYQLTPGYRATVSDKKVTIKKVNIYEDIAWKEGQFVFAGKRLEEVMTILARWYDLEVVYQNAEIKDKHFTGKIRRHASIKEVLKFLERTHIVHFKIQNHVVIVTK